jgi:hypothetical protein
MRFIPSKEIRPNVLQISEIRAFIPDWQSRDFNQPISFNRLV